MLILTRRVKETLMIGNDVQVTVLGVKGNQVRIGIAAPQAVHILREELLTPKTGETTTPLNSTKRNYYGRRY